MKSVIELANEAGRTLYDTGLMEPDEFFQRLYDLAVADVVKQRDELLEALSNAVSVAKTARDHWDKDEDSKVGKYLIALSGYLPGYDKRTDEIHAAIAKVKE